jgi:hypothetical protein
MGKPSRGAAGLGWGAELLFSWLVFKWVGDIFDRLNRAIYDLYIAQITRSMNNFICKIIVLVASQPIFTTQPFTSPTTDSLVLPESSRLHLGYSLLFFVGASKLSNHYKS